MSDPVKIEFGRLILELTSTQMLEIARHDMVSSEFLLLDSATYAAIYSPETTPGEDEKEARP